MDENSNISSNKITDENEDFTAQINDLLEPQFYPDPVLFRDSFEKIKQYDNDLKNNLKSNKTTIHVLAPYLKTIYKDQKKVLESAKNLSFSAKTKEAKLLLFEKKSKDQFSGTPDVADQYEMVVSIHETADVLKTLVKTNNVVSYLVNPTKNELYQSPRYVVSSMSTLTWKIETNTTMAAYAASTKQYVISDNVLADTRFPLGLGFPASLIKYGLCVPIKTPDDKVVAVYELTRDAFDVRFETKDIQLVLTITGWMGFAIFYNGLYTNLMRQLELSDYLLQLTNHYHGGHATLEKTLSDIVLFARQTLAAERCNLYLVEKETEDTLTIEEYDHGIESTKSPFRRRAKKNVDRHDGSYLSKVVFGKQVVNKHEIVVDISADSDITLRSIICIPILCKCDDIIGVIQLANKKTAPQFDEEDEEILKMFAAFCAMNINSFKLQEKEKKSTLQNNVNREMLLYHMNPCVHDQNLVNRHLESLPDEFFTMTWYPSPDQRSAVLAEFTVHMFHEVIGDRFMSSNNIEKFLLTACNCYRPNPYHNFLHAFTATHKMANLIRNYGNMFNGVERKGLMVAILCHDVDHQGYSNSFIKLTNHYLSNLYDSSPLENHHFAVTKMIIEKCGVFKYLKPEAYSKQMTEIYECILATDLSYYFQSRMQLLKLADEKSLNWKETNHRRLLKNLMMVGCDLSDLARPFPECKKITEDLYEEFFYQGDMEKKIGLVPLPLMDRLKKDMIPENQIQFLIVVLLPCLETLSQIFSIVSPLVSHCNEVICQWKNLIEVKDQDTWKPEESISKP